MLNCILLSGAFLVAPVDQERANEALRNHHIRMMAKKEAEDAHQYFWIDPLTNRKHHMERPVYVLTEVQEQRRSERIAEHKSRQAKVQHTASLKHQQRLYRRYGIVPRYILDHEKSIAKYKGTPKQSEQPWQVFQRPAWQAGRVFWQP